MSLTADIASDKKSIVLKIAGRFDFELHQSFRSAYEMKDVDGKTVAYVIDLKDTEYIDSSALGMLLLLREYAGGDNAKIKIINCRKEVQEILQIASFDKLFDVKGR